MYLFDGRVSLSKSDRHGEILDVYQPLFEAPDPAPASTVGLVSSLSDWLTYSVVACICVVHIQVLHVWKI